MDFYEFKRAAASFNGHEQFDKKSATFHSDMPNRAMQRDQAVASAQFKRGLVPEKTQIRASINEYTKLIALNPKDAAPFYNRGILYICAEQWQNAIADLSKAGQFQAQGRSPVLSKLLSAQCLERMHQEKQATDLLKTMDLAKTKDALAERTTRFLAHSIDREQYLKGLSKSDEGWARYFAAVHCLNAGIAENTNAARESARRDLLWIRDFADVESDEYTLAMVELTRLEQTKQAKQPR